MCTKQTKQGFKVYIYNGTEHANLRTNGERYTSSYVCNEQDTQCNQTKKGRNNTNSIIKVCNKNTHLYILGGRTHCGMMISVQIEYKALILALC